MPIYDGRQTSVICNPPFSYEPDIAELIIATIIERFNVRRAAFIVPIAFLNSQERRTGNKFSGRGKQSTTAIYRDRPPMHPGTLLNAMATPLTARMADNSAVIFATRTTE